MKTYKKENLKYKNGYIFKGDKIVGIDNDIVDLANKMETDTQRKYHEVHNKIDINDVEEFNRVSEFSRPLVMPSTPKLDKKIEESIELMDELDGMQKAEEANEYLESIHPVVQFIQEDFVIDCKQDTQHKFDLPVLGNPLEWDREFLDHFIKKLFE